jgi:hypothetical protein
LKKLLVCELVYSVHGLSPAKGGHPGLNSHDPFNHAALIIAVVAASVGDAADRVVDDPV